MMMAQLNIPSHWRGACFLPGYSQNFYILGNLISWLKTPPKIKISKISSKNFLELNSMLTKSVFSTKLCVSI